MTKRFLTPISLANLSADPTGSSGAFYYNTTSNVLKYYNGTTWGTLALNNQAFFIGSTSITINQGTGTITALAGVTSVNGTTIPAASTLLTTTSTTSALTTVGTITSGTWSGSFGAVSGANLTSLTAANIAAGTLGSSVLPAAGTITTAGQIGYMGLPQNLNPGAYTLTAADNGKHIYYTTTGQTVTIPANATLALPVGFACVIANGSGVTTTISITTDTLVLAGTSLATGTRTLSQFGLANLIKVTTTSWMISGAGLT